MKSNCWRYAHEEFNRTDGQVWLCFRLTNRSKWSLSKIPTPVRWLARAMIYETYRLHAWICLAAYGGWCHVVVRDDMPPGFRDFASHARKVKRWFPPMSYEGEVKTHDRHR